MECHTDGEPFLKSLTMDELRQMPGQPVWCNEANAFGIVKCDKRGKWAGIPFIHGSQYNNESGTFCDFDWNAEERNLSCYRIIELS